MAGRPTILDVAREAGVSKAFVSFALNDRPGVSPDSRERILRVAAELGYRPSLTARSLSTSVSFAVGLVVARDPAVIAADPFFPSFISGVERVLAERGRVLVLSVVDPPRRHAGATSGHAPRGRRRGRPHRADPQLHRRGAHHGDRRLGRLRHPARLLAGRRARERDGAVRSRVRAAARAGLRGAGGLRSALLVE
ncbi:hypothetical protein C5C99_00360 [Rathayibacter sp. AY1C4]|nr:hypothetical protein C5C99_00360 [Rathayibacter sp. AY1C4]